MPLLFLSLLLTCCLFETRSFSAFVPVQSEKRLLHPNSPFHGTWDSRFLVHCFTLTMSTTQNKSLVSSGPPHVQTPNVKGLLQCQRQNRASWLRTNFFLLWGDEAIRKIWQLRFYLPPQRYKPNANSVPQISSEGHLSLLKYLLQTACFTIHTCVDQSLEVYIFSNSKTPIKLPENFLSTKDQSNMVTVRKTKGLNLDLLHM